MDVSQARPPPCGVTSIRGARRIDASAPQRLVRVDVPDAGDGALVHQHLFDRLAASPKKDR